MSQTWTWPLTVPIIPPALRQTYRLSITPLKRVLVLTRDPELPSFRYRISPLIEQLEHRGAEVQVKQFKSRRYFLRLMNIKRAVKEADVVLVQKLKLLPFESKLLASLNPNVVFDLDDAIYVKQPKQAGDTVAPDRGRLSKFAGLAKAARFVSVGNGELASKVREAGGTADFYPTGIDVASYKPVPTSQKSGFTAIWIGLPANIRYLEMIRPALAKIAKKHPKFRLIIMSSEWPEWDDVPVEGRKWSSEAEKSVLPLADIGIMPLSDDLFSRGKCAFKLLQYMAAGLPCIASPVGANCDVIEPGVNGFLASDTDGWVDSFDQILGNQDLQQAFATAGRSKVESHYDLDTIAKRYAEKLYTLN